MAPEKLPSLGQISVASETGTGSALENLNRRLTGLYGSNDKYALTCCNSFSKVIVLLRAPCKFDLKNYVLK